MTDIVTPEGYEVHREYDMRDRVVCETFTDKKNGISKKVTYEYDKVGNLVVATDGLGASELWTYDKSDRILSRTDKAGRKKCYRYDRNGRLIKVMDGDQFDAEKQDGAGTSYTYDGFGRILSVRNALGYLEEQNQYDRAGNLLERSDETGVLARFTYDIGGRTTSVTNGSLIKNEREGISQKYAYDAMGHVVGVVDGEQNHTHFELDEWGRVTEITKPDGSRETYTYDYAGNVTSTTDGLGHTISYEYNTMNQLGVITEISKWGIYLISRRLIVMIYWICSGVRS